MKQLLVLLMSNNMERENLLNDYLTEYTPENRMGFMKLVLKKYRFENYKISDNDIKYETFNIFADEQKLRIQDETSGEYGDLHPSLFANKIIAKMVYNDMIKRNYITGDIIPIPKKINFKENLKNTLI